MTDPSRRQIRRLSIAQVFRGRGNGAAHDNGRLPRSRADAERSDELLHDESSLMRELELEVERAKRGSRRLSVLVGQLGSQDVLNETDRAVTETILDRAGGALEEQKRQIDTVALLGRGRVVVILPETGEPGALKVAERLRAAVAGAFREHDNVPRLIFGVASFGRHGRSASALLVAAERAVLVARRLDQQGSLIDGDEISAAMASVMNPSDGVEDALETALALAETVDVRDRGVAGHSHVVGRYAKLIARELGLSDEATERIRLAGVLHDIGKVGVSRSVLQKPGPLSDDEWAAVRKHAKIGARILATPALRDISAWVLHHHERPDGGGYPDRLRGGEIALESRIIAVADAYESMTSDRVHRSALSHDEARAELLAGSGTQFDRRVVDAFTRVLDRQGLGSPRAAA
jgi:diguanylate cyclase (GGDEF)-like protein/putative nucleotidyltransferase with HDIG domain